MVKRVLENKQNKRVKKAKNTDAGPLATVAEMRLN